MGLCSGNMPAFAEQRSPLCNEGSVLKPKPTILVIDDEKSSRRLLRVILTPHGYRFFEAESGRAGFNKAAQCNPDVIILELGESIAEGLAILQGLQEWCRAALLVLSRQTAVEAKVAALDAGARDYLTKPFSSPELLARLRVLQRPLPNVPDGPFLIDGELEVNLATHKVRLGGCPISLTPKEEALFCVLARYAGRVVTREHLVRSVWGICSEEKGHDLRVLMSHLRDKLRPHGRDMLVKTEADLGYSLSLFHQREPSLSHFS